MMNHHVYSESIHCIEKKYSSNFILVLNEEQVRINEELFRKNELPEQKKILELT